MNQYTLPRSGFSNGKRAVNRATKRAVRLALALLAFLLAGSAWSEPPSRVARLGYLSGPVSFSPAGEAEWAGAALNRPLGAGDRLWTDTGARAELQIGTAAIRMSDRTNVTLLNLDDNVAQFQLLQGDLSLGVCQLYPNQVFEVDTLNLACVIRALGQYRVTVAADGAPPRFTPAAARRTALWGVISGRTPRCSRALPTI